MGAELLARIRDAMSPMKSRVTVLTWGIFFAGVLLYVYRLGALGFTTDEIYHGIAAQKILETGVPIFPDGTVYLKGAPFSYLGAGIALLIGPTEVAVRLVSVASMLATGYVILRFVREWASAEAGLLASFVWLFHPWTVELARWGRHYTLAALGFSSFVYCLLRYEGRGNRRDLYVALALLAFTIAVHPMGIWGLAVLWGYWVVRGLQGEQWRRTAIGAAAVALSASAAIVIVWKSDHLAALAPIVGFLPRVELSKFIEFSEFYPRFFLEDLPVFAVSLLLLAYGTLRRRDDSSGLRRDAVLFIATVGGVLFVSFVHLQSAASRYLFPFFPILVMAAVFAWAREIEQGLKARRVYAYLVLCAAMVAYYTVAGSFRIPFKDYGDPYENVRFAPTSTRSRYENYKDPMLFVKARAGRDDIVVTNKHQYFYFYAGREADFDTRRGTHVKRGGILPYMRHTKKVRSYHELARIVRRNRDKTFWFVFDTDRQTKRMIRRLSKTYPLKLEYRDSGDRNARVYRSGR